MATVPPASQGSPGENLLERALAKVYGALTQPEKPAEKPTEPKPLPPHPKSA